MNTTYIHQNTIRSVTYSLILVLCCGIYVLQQLWYLCVSTIENWKLKFHTYSGTKVRINSIIFPQYTIHISFNHSFKDLSFHRIECPFHLVKVFVWGLTSRIFVIHRRTTGSFRKHCSLKSMIYSHEYGNLIVLDFFSFYFIGKTIVYIVPMKLGLICFDCFIFYGGFNFKDV